jgi:hypothetical protein
MLTACEDMRTIRAKMKINRALRKSVPPSADTLYFPGEHVLFFRENTKRFEGPFQISHVLGKPVYVTTSGGRFKLFSRAQVKHYRMPEVQTCPDVLNNFLVRWFFK